MKTCNSLSNMLTFFNNLIYYAYKLNKGGICQKTKPTPSGFPAC